MKRLFIETDILIKDEYRSAQRTVHAILFDQGITCHEEVFDEISERAWHQWENAWEAIKRCDEIYGDSALVPLCGFGSYTGAPVVMDVMMKKAIEENITGKSLYFLRTYNDIEWEGIDYKLMKKCFKNNKLFTLDEDREKFVQVDISKMEPWK